MQGMQANRQRAYDSWTALESEETFLMQSLDTLFKNWGILNGASTMTMPLLLPVKDLALLDVYFNFPQQAFLVSSLNVEQFTHDPMNSEITQIRSDILEPVKLGIPTAACYAVYLHYRGQEIPPTGVLITLNGHCCHKESKERRGAHLPGWLGFHAREIVALGSQAFTELQLEQISEKIQNLASLLGLPLRKEQANPSFFQPEYESAAEESLLPISYEYLLEDTVVASLTHHGNFFAKRCQITLAKQSADNHPNSIFTSCVAFGLEHWLSALYRHYGNWSAPIEAIRSLGWAA